MYRRSSYQEERVGIPLTSLTLPHFNACPKPGTGFPITYVSGLFSSPGPKVHGNYWRPSSVNFSHFKLLLRNHWANWNQT